MQHAVKIGYFIRSPVKPLHFPDLGKNRKHISRHWKRWTVDKGPFQRADDHFKKERQKNL
jgi:hypothetical protein